MAKLGDICTHQSSNIKQSDLENNNGSYPIYGASGLIKNVDFYKQEKPYVAIVKDGAGVGRVMQLPAYSSVIGTMQYIIPNSDTDVKYLAYAMEHMNLSKYYSGATIPHIYFKDYKNEYIKEHNTETQKQIAATLDKVTHTIDTCNAILEKLDLLVKSRFIEMFNTGEYTTVKLKSVCSKITDGTHKTPNYLPEGITFISAKNIINGELDFSDVKYISETEYNEIQKRCQTEIHDILLSKSGSLGSPTILRTDKPLGLFESLAIIKYDRRIMLPEFLCEQLKTDDIQRQFKIGTKGVAIKHLHLNVIGDIDVVVPPLALQQQFADFVEQTDKSKLAVKQVLEKAETLKKALMQEYFGQEKL